MLQPYTVARRPERTRSRPAAGRGPVHNDEILDAIRRWANQYGEPPTSTDWERPGPGGRASPGEQSASSWTSGRPCAWCVRASEASTPRSAGRDCARGGRRRVPGPTSPAPSHHRAIVEWTRRYGDVPSMADWDPVRARALGQEWRVQRYHDGDWPSARSVAHHFGSFASAVSSAGLVPRERSVTREHRDAARRHNRFLGRDRAQRGRPRGRRGRRRRGPRGRREPALRRPGGAACRAPGPCRGGARLRRGRCRRD